MHQCLNTYADVAKDRVSYAVFVFFPQNAFSDHFALQLPAVHKEIVEVARCILYSEVSDAPACSKSSSSGAAASTSASGTSASTN